MAFVKIENGVVVQKQYKPRKGFVEVDNGVVCGMLHDGHNFTNPPHVPREELPVFDVVKEVEKIWGEIKKIKEGKPK